jgi:hypothetical protein
VKKPPNTASPVVKFPSGVTATSSDNSSVNFDPTGLLVVKRKTSPHFTVSAACAFATPSASIESAPPASENAEIVECNAPISASSSTFPPAAWGSSNILSGIHAVPDVFANVVPVILVFATSPSLEKLWLSIP